MISFLFSYFIVVLWTSCNQLSPNLSECEIGFQVEMKVSELFLGFVGQDIPRC